MEELFRKQNSFSSHTLLVTATKVFSYLHYLSYENSVVDIFLQEKQQSVKKLKNRANLEEGEEEKIVCYKFLKKVTLAIEVIREYTDEEMEQRSRYGKTDKQDVLVYHFKVSGAAIYLSKQSKFVFEHSVKRTDGEAKINALMSTFPTFLTEIKDNKKSFRNYFWLFRVVENLFYLEMLCYALAVIINGLYLADY